MFTELYLDTTNPKAAFSDLFSRKLLLNILFSDIFHTILYTSFLNIANYIFFGKLLSKTINIRIVLFLLVFMFFGFLGRYLHVKDIYKAYNYDLEKTRNHLDKLYITWIFIS